MPEHTTTNIISSIKLPNGTTYQIHDEHAIHSVEELGLSAALVFKGTKASVSDLPTSGNKVGDVWYITADDSEYVWTDYLAWEAFGGIHDSASSDHTHSVAVTGTNAASAVTGHVVVPTVSSTQKYLTATNNTPDVETSTGSVLGANTTFTVSGGEVTTTKIKAIVSDIDIAGNGTAAAITGFDAHTTGSAMGAEATFKVNGGDVTTRKMEKTSVSKVSKSGSKTDGTAASWSANVTNGVLSFDWVTNTPTAVTLPTFESVEVANGHLSEAGFGDAVATGVSAFTVVVEDAKPVEAITALGTATTADALTDIQVVTQPTFTFAPDENGDISIVTGISAISVTANDDDNVTAITGVEVGASEITLINSATNAAGAVPVVSDVSIGSVNAELQNGSAAAQVWTQTDGATGAPVTP